MTSSRTTPSEDDVYPFTPLYPGTIRDLFSRRRSTPPPKTVFDELTPPEGSQCAHVEFEVGEKVTIIQCQRDADSSGRHGFLCTEHYAQQSQTRRDERRDRDVETVSSIVVAERRALYKTPREVVVISPSIRIQFVRKT